MFHTKILPMFFGLLCAPLDNTSNVPTVLFGPVVWSDCSRRFFVRVTDSPVSDNEDTRSDFNGQQQTATVDRTRKLQSIYREERSDSDGGDFVYTWRQEQEV